MRIGYCLTVHAKPEQVRRLVDRIYSDDDHFYVDVFNNNAQEAWKKALALEGSNFTTVFKYADGWGTFKLVQATLDAMRHFREKSYDYFTNLSGQCYPLRPLADIKERLNAARGKAFMEYEPFPRPRWSDERGGFRRIERYYVKPFRNFKMWSFPRLSSIPLGMRPFGGSQWYCLPKRHVEYILSTLDEYPEIERFYRNTLIPDEMFFQTILMNSELRDEVVNDSKRFTDWEKKCVPTPAILTKEDMPRLERSGKFFARKFEPAIDSKILDLLDIKILGRPVEDDEDDNDRFDYRGGRRVRIRTVS